MNDSRGLPPVCQRHTRRHDNRPHLPQPQLLQPLPSSPHEHVRQRQRQRMVEPQAGYNRRKKNQP